MFSSTLLTFKPESKKKTSHLNGFDNWQKWFQQRSDDNKLFNRRIWSSIKIQRGKQTEGPSAQHERPVCSLKLHENLNGVIGSRTRQVQHRTKCYIQGFIYIHWRYSRALEYC